MRHPEARPQKHIKTLEGYIINNTGYAAPPPMSHAPARHPPAPRVSARSVANYGARRSTYPSATMVARPRRHPIQCRACTANAAHKDPCNAPRAPHAPHRMNVRTQARARNRRAGRGRHRPLAIHPAKQTAFRTQTIRPKQELQPQLTQAANAQDPVEPWRRSYGCLRPLPKSGDNIGTDAGCPMRSFTACT